MRHLPRRQHAFGADDDGGRPARHAGCASPRPARSAARRPASSPGSARRAPVPPRGSPCACRRGCRAGRRRWRRSPRRPRGCSRRSCAGRRRSCSPARRAAAGRIPGRSRSLPRSTSWGGGSSSCAFSIRNAHSSAACTPSARFDLRAAALIGSEAHGCDLIRVIAHPASRRRSGVTSPRASMASRMVLLIALTGR